MARSAYGAEQEAVQPRQLANCANRSRPAVGQRAALIGGGNVIYVMDVTFLVACVTWNAEDRPQQWRTLLGAYACRDLISLSPPR